MKKVLGLSISCLAIIGVASLFNVHAENVGEQVTPFDQEQVKAKIGMSFDNGTFDYSSLYLKFGMTFDKSLYTPGSEYGVVAVDASNIEDVQKTKDLATNYKYFEGNNFLVNCTDKVENQSKQENIDKIEYYWAINNIDILDPDMEFYILMYEKKTDNTFVTSANPAKRSLNSVIDDYIDKWNTLFKTQEERDNMLNAKKALIKLGDKKGTEYYVEDDILEEKIKNNGNISGAYNLYAYIWEKDGEKTIVDGHFVKVENGRYKVNNRMNNVTFVFDQENKLLGFNWPDNYNPVQTVDLLIKEINCNIYNVDISKVGVHPVQGSFNDINKDLYAWVWGKDTNGKWKKVENNQLILDKKYTNAIFVNTTDNNWPWVNWGNVQNKTVDLIVVKNQIRVPEYKINQNELNTHLNWGGLKGNDFWIVARNSITHEEKKYFKATMADDNLYFDVYPEFEFDEIEIYIGNRGNTDKDYNPNKGEGNFVTKTGPFKMNGKVVIIK